MARAAWAEARELLAAHPQLGHSDSGLMALAYVQVHSGEHAAARASAEELLARWRGGEREHLAWHQLGMVQREAGEHAAALETFRRERALIEGLNLAPEESAMKLAANGYELVVNHLALGERGAAQAALPAALEHAQAAGDPVTLGCVWRAAGDLLAAQGRPGAAAAYASARHHFADAGDDLALQDLDRRLAGL